MDQADTPLDRAIRARLSDPEADAPRLAVLAALADCELSLLLADDGAEGDAVTPETRVIDEATFVLGFEGEERLAAFAGGGAFSAGLPGRALVEMLAGQGIGLALNPGTEGLSLLLDIEEIDWLAATLGGVPEEEEASVTALAPPAPLPAPVMTALDGKLARAGAIASGAVMVGVRYDDGREGNLLAFFDPAPGAEAALAAAVREALVFSDDAATPALDVAFFPGEGPIAERLRAVGIPVDLPSPAATPTPTAPGSDPARPPRLR